MKFYRLIMDSIKLFFVNVFMLAIFLEVYVIIVLMRENLNLELPFFEYLFVGLGIFIALIIWINIAGVWYQKKISRAEMLQRSLISEIPFIVLLIIFWILAVMNGRTSEMSGTVTLFAVFIVLFPTAMVLMKSHLKKLSR
jgi:hypothetical protein